MLLPCLIYNRHIIKKCWISDGVDYIFTIFEKYCEYIAILAYFKNIVDFL